MQKLRAINRTLNDLHEEIRVKMFVYKEFRGN